MARWWVRKLSESIQDNTAQSAKINSISALAEAESMRDRVEAVSGSIGVQNVNNHYARRIEKSYARAFGITPERPLEP